MNGAAVRPHPSTVVLAVSAWSGVLLQAFLTLRTATLSGQSIAAGLLIFFSYLTVLTNLLVCVAVTAPLLARRSALGSFFRRPEVIAGVATSILFVCLSYHLLLRNVWNPQGLQLLCDRLLHYVTPLLFLAYWWFIAPKSGLLWRHPFIWGLYPTFYLVYALLLGASSGRYAYAFIDAGVIGYWQALVNGIGLLLVYIVLGLLLVACGRLQSPSR